MLSFVLSCVIEVLSKGPAVARADMLVNCSSNRYRIVNCSSSSGTSERALDCAAIGVPFSSDRAEVEIHS